VSNTHLSDNASTYLWDSSHCGRLRITGPDGEDLLHRISTNDIMGLSINRSLMTLFTNPKGRIIDRVRIMKNETCMIMSTSENCSQTIQEWIESYTFMEDLTVTDITNTTKLIDILGAGSVDVIDFLANNYGGHSPSLIGNGLLPNQSVTYEQIVLDQDDNDLMIITRTDSLLSPSYSILCSNSMYAAILHCIKVNFPNIKWITPAEHETLRISAGIPKLPNEINLKTNPLEIGLRDDISFDKGCYIGQEVILRLDTYKKVKRHLVKVSLESDIAPIIGSDIVSSNTTTASGKLTSISLNIDGTGFDGLALVKSVVHNYDQRFEIHQDGIALNAALQAIPEPE
jgi:folate-binding protein YgfZ